MPITHSTVSANHNGMTISIDLKNREENTSALIRETAKTFSIEYMNELKNEILHDAIFDEDFYSFFKEYIQDISSVRKEKDDKNDREILTNVTEWRYFIRSAFNEMQQDSVLEEKITDIVINYFLSKERVENITSLSDRQEMYKQINVDLHSLFLDRLELFLNKEFNFMN